jgi:hypothetical protein
MEKAINGKKAACLGRPMMNLQGTVFFASV